MKEAFHDSLLKLLSQGMGPQCFYVVTGFSKGTPDSVRASGKGGWEPGEAGGGVG